MKQIACIVLMGIVLMGFASCGGNEEPPVKNYYTVTFDADGGTPVPEAQRVEEGKTAAAPATHPVKQGYVFEYWSADGTNAYNFQTPVTKNLTLRAKWKEEGNQPQTGKKAVASGYHGCFILNQDGTLLALGHNADGQLGTGNTNEVGELTQVASGVSAVYAGEYTSVVLKTDGSLLGSGSNSDGALGLEAKKAYHAFTSIPVSDVGTVAMGASFTLILKNNGSVWATGWNAYGQLGVGDKTARDKFTATNLTADVIAIAAGGGHSLALKKDGTVWGAGYGYVGSLGVNAPDAENPSFVQIFSGAKAIAAGSEHSLILKSDGTVYAAGGNGYGQTGTGNTNEVKTFTPAVESSGTPLRNVAEIFAGYYRSFALKTDGTLWAAGDNSYRQLVAGSDDNCPEFVKVASDVKSASIGRTHSLVLMTDGTVQTLGYVNPYDQLGGNGTIEVKVNDTYRHDYITYLRLYDRSKTAVLHYYDKDIVTGGPAYTIKVKPGTYHLELKPKNATVSTTHNFTVPDNGKVTVLYEWVSQTVGYRWTVTISK